MMEEKKESAGGLFKVRTYGACLSEGIKLPTRNVIVLLKHLWVAVACVVVFVSVWGFTAVPAYRAWTEAQLWGTWPAWRVAGLFVAACLLVLSVPVGLYLGQLTVLVRRYGCVGYLPASTAGLKVYGREVLAGWGRAFLFLLGGLLLWGVAGGLSFAFVGRNWAGLAVFTLAGLLISIPYAMFGLFYLFDEAGPASLPVVFRQGYKHWGALAAVLLLGGVLAGVLLFVSALPAGVILQVDFLSDQALMQGDLSDLPSAFPVLQTVSYVLAAFLACLSLWVFVFPLAFLFGSIKQARQEKTDYAAEQQTAGK